MTMPPDCAEEGVSQRIPKRKRGSVWASILFWAFMVWIFAAIMGLALTTKAHAQTFAPANDSSAIILEVRNFDTDSADVFLGLGHDFHEIGWVRGNSRRIFTIPSTSLGETDHVIVAITQNGDVLRTPGPVVIPRGQWWVVAVGVPPKKESA